MARKLTPNVEQFVLQNIRSLEHLDTFLALHREPDRWWTAETVAQLLGVPADDAERVLEHLCSANLLDVRGGSALSYQFSPGSAAVDAVVKELVDALGSDRVRIYRLITSRSARALQDLADAFRFRGRNRG